MSLLLIDGDVRPGAVASMLSPEFKRVRMALGNSDAGMDGLLQVGTWKTTIYPAPFDACYNSVVFKRLMPCIPWNSDCREENIELTGLDSTDVLQRELQKGEKLVWTGRPKQGILLRPSDLYLIPFSLMWCGFALFWEWGVITEGKSLFMQIWGIPFVLVGVYIVAGRFFVDAHARSRTHYGLTQDRVLVIGGPFRSSVHSHQLRLLPQTRLIEHGSGLGTIELNTADSNLTARGRSTASFDGWSPNRLERIADARQVYQQILELQRSNNRASA